jgi:hypothetical protein
MSEAEISGLTHVDAAGHARMVDVSGKDVTARSAERALKMDGAPARARVLERYSVQAVFPRWWDAIQAALAL